MYRLHIDLPLGVDQSVATERAKQIIATLEDAFRKIAVGGDIMQHKLCKDDERSGRNYLIIREENGLPANKKCRVTF